MFRIWRKVKRFADQLPGELQGFSDLYPAKNCMETLVIAATSLEIGPFLDRIGSLDNRPEVLITGVGLTASTCALTRYLATHRPECIIQAGIAGSFDPAITPGEVLLVGRDRIADQGVFENGEWKDTMDMGFTPANESPYTDGWLVNPWGFPNPGGLRLADAISVNQVSTNPQLISEFRRKYNPSLESMEGAALHFVAISEKIPFVQVRAVSNYVGERDKSRWDIKNAVIALNKVLPELLSQQQSVRP